MSTWMKRTCAALAALAGERKLQRAVAVTVAPLAARASGAMLVVTPNITAGANSAITTYSETDWVRTLRHGVTPGGRPLMVMPSEVCNRLTDADLAALIGYVRQLAPAPGQARVVRLPVAVKVLYAMGVVKDAYELIDHTQGPPAPVKAEVSVAHGAYVASSCIGCHGVTLSAGKVAGVGLPDAGRRQRNQPNDAVRLAGPAQRCRRAGTLRLPGHAAGARRGRALTPAA